MSGTCDPLFLFIFFLGFGFPWTLRKRKYLHQNPSRPSRTHHVLLLTDDLANRLICTGTWVFHFLFRVRVLPWTLRKWKYLHHVTSLENPACPLHSPEHSAFTPPHYSFDLWSFPNPLSYTLYHHHIILLLQRSSSSRIIIEEKERERTVVKWSS